MLQAFNLLRITEAAGRFRKGSLLPKSSVAKAWTRNGVQMPILPAVRFRGGSLSYVLCPGKNAPSGEAYESRAGVAANTMPFRPEWRKQPDGTPRLHIIPRAGTARKSPVTCLACGGEWLPDL